MLSAALRAASTGSLPASGGAPWPQGASGAAQGVQDFRDEDPLFGSGASDEDGSDEGHDRCVGVGGRRGCCGRL